MEHQQAYACVLEDWAYRRGVQLDLIRQGKPVENAFIELCKGRLHDECLNVHKFAWLAEAIIEAWRWTTSASASQLDWVPGLDRVRCTMPGTTDRRRRRLFWLRIVSERGQRQTVSSIEDILAVSGERSAEGCHHKFNAYWVAGGLSPLDQRCLPPNKYPPVNHL